MKYRIQKVSDRYFIQYKTFMIWYYYMCELENNDKIMWSFENSKDASQAIDYIKQGIYKLDYKISIYAE